MPGLIIRCVSAPARPRAPFCELGGRGCRDIRDLGMSRYLVDLDVDRPSEATHWNPTRTIIIHHVIRHVQNHIYLRRASAPGNVKVRRIAVGEGVAGLAVGPRRAGTAMRDSGDIIPNSGKIPGMPYRARCQGLYLVCRGSDRRGRQ
jgi:hypothetical protein